MGPHAAQGEARTFAVDLILSLSKEGSWHDGLHSLDLVVRQAHHEVFESVAVCRGMRPARRSAPGGRGS
ncbi:MAG: hypothetical protein ABS76_06660 [Pelagibacterium sp. SCN 64-44]|nr:MAG: hypothetical protein ABS76_06660 [Pelagibacterium sp. SCN 64-44]